MRVPHTLLVTLLAIFGVVQALHLDEEWWGPECPIEGQVFKECKGCDGTCLNQNPICPLICEPGCSCPAGTVVHEGKCSSPDECPEWPIPECDIEGQEFSECKGCDGTCLNPNPVCSLICEPGCSCVNVTVVHEGKCISPDECPQLPECPIEGQEFSECKGCDGTCEQPLVPCPKICLPGCSCPDGMVINEGKCIPEADCECPIEGQVFSECKGCDGTCEQPLVACPAICLPGCSCPVGTVVHEGKCTPLEECPPPECPIEGQIFSECKGCDGTCEQPLVACPKICEPGCSCPVGTVVHEGKCIPLEDCPPPECPIEGQIFKECKGCDGTCLNPNPICPLICEPGCSCTAGTVVHKGKCISPDECPQLPRCEIKGQIWYRCKPCDGRHPTCLVPNPPCPRSCVPGCACPFGLVVHDDRCIPPEACPPVFPWPPGDE